ncbi:unnamed protein product [Closterium sp. NIES-54]
MQGSRNLLSSSGDVTVAIISHDWKDSAGKNAVDGGNESDGVDRVDSWRGAFFGEVVTVEEVRKDPRETKRRKGNRGKSRVGEMRGGDAAGKGRTGGKREIGLVVAIAGKRKGKKREGKVAIEVVALTNEEENDIREEAGEKGKGESKGFESVRGREGQRDERRDGGRDKGHGEKDKSVRQESSTREENRKEEGARENGSDTRQKEEVERKVEAAAGACEGQLSSRGAQAAEAGGEAGVVAQADATVETNSTADVVREREAGGDSNATGEAGTASGGGVSAGAVIAVAKVRVSLPHALYRTLRYESHRMNSETSQNLLWPRFYYRYHWSCLYACVSTPASRPPLLLSPPPLLLPQGNLGARLQALCLAPAVSAVWSTRALGEAGPGKAEADKAGEVTVVWSDSAIADTDVDGSAADSAGGSPKKRPAGEGFLDLFSAFPGVDLLALDEKDKAAWPSVTVTGAASAAPLLESQKEVQVSLPACVNEESESANSATSGNSSSAEVPELSLSLRVPSGLINVASREWTPPEACSALRQFQSCLGALQPSSRVTRLLEEGALGETETAAGTPEELVKEERGGVKGGFRKRLARSTAVYLEANQVMPGGTCGGCPEDPLLNCTLRTLTWRYLRVPSNSSDVDFTVAAASATDAATVAGTFHPLRAPLLLPHTAARTAMGCPLRIPPSSSSSSYSSSSSSSPTTSSNSSPSPPPSLSSVSSSSPSASSRRLLALKGEEKEQGELEKESGSLADTTGSNSPGSESPGSDSSENRSSGASSSSGSGASSSSGSGASGAEGHKWSCGQLELAELLLLSWARGLIHSRPSIEALFIAAQGRRHRTSHSSSVGGDVVGASAEAGAVLLGAAFAVEKSVCSAPRAAGFVNQKYLQQMLVDEELKTVYCSVPKVACTSWKVWFREQLSKRLGGNKSHRVKLFARTSVHSPLQSGLSIMGYGFEEQDNIRFLTRPDFFKFSFVRNPLTRIASAYLNKHVHGVGLHGRKYWNERFFMGISAYNAFLKSQNGSDFIPFSTFMSFLRQRATRCVECMDPHVRPQIDLCKLDAIRYDFIGRFENLEEDVAKVMRHFGEEEKNPFHDAHWAHPTNASARLLELYDKSAYEDATITYNSEFSVPLNGLEYRPPQALADMFETKS